MRDLLFTTKIDALNKKSLLNTTDMKDVKAHVAAEKKQQQIILGYCDDAMKALKNENPKNERNAAIVKEIENIKKEIQGNIKGLDNYQEECEKAFKTNRPFPDPPSRGLSYIQPTNLNKAIAFYFIRLAYIKAMRNQNQGIFGEDFDNDMDFRIENCEKNLAALKNTSPLPAGIDADAVVEELGNIIQLYESKEVPADQAVPPTEKELLLASINRGIMRKQTMVMVAGAALHKTAAATSVETLKSLQAAVINETDPKKIAELKKLHQEYSIQSTAIIEGKAQNGLLMDLGMANLHTDIEKKIQSINNPAAQNTGVAQPAATHPMQINNQNASPQPQPGGGDPMQQQMQQRVRAQHAYQNTYIVSPRLYKGILGPSPAGGLPQQLNDIPIFANNVDKILTEMDTVTGTARNVFVEYNTPSETQEDKYFKVVASLQAAIESIGEPLSIDGTDEEYLQMAFEHCIHNKIKFDDPPHSQAAAQALAKARSSIMISPHIITISKTTGTPNHTKAMEGSIKFDKWYREEYLNNTGNTMNNNNNNAPGPNQNPNPAQGFVVDSDWQDYLSKLDQWGKNEFGKINMDRCDPDQKQAMKTKQTFYENVSTVSSALLAACKTPMPQADREELIKALYKFGADIGAISGNRQEADITTWAQVFTAANNAARAAVQAANNFQQGGPANNNKNNNMERVHKIGDNLKKGLENMAQDADSAKTNMARDNQGKSKIEENPDYKFHNQLQIQCDELAKIANNPMHADDKRKFENDADAFLNKARALSNKGAGRNATDELALKDQGEALIKFGNEAVQRTKPNPAPPQAAPSLSITPQKI